MNSRFTNSSNNGVIHLAYCSQYQGQSGWLDQTLKAASSTPIEVLEVHEVGKLFSLLRTARTDIIVLDQSHGHEGWQRIASTIRTVTHPYLPIIVLSDNASKFDASRCLEGGVDLVCPANSTTPRELALYVERFVERALTGLENEYLRKQQQLTRDEPKHDQLVEMIQQRRDTLLSLLPSSDRLVDERLQVELQQILQASLVSGTDQLQREIGQLAQSVQHRQIVQYTIIHSFYEALLQLVEQLGPRGARRLDEISHTVLAELLVMMNKQWSPTAIAQPAFLSLAN